jgi:hypothetical protein
MNLSAAKALPFVCLGALFLGEPSAFAKPAVPKEGPPVLAPMELKVEGRLPVRIVLKAAGLQRSPVTFLLRGKPEFGQVRLLKQLAGDSVEVEYEPPADRLILADSFLFAGYNAQGFSSDCRARIQIVDIGPRLGVPLALDFAATRVGQSVRLPLEVRNSGDQPGEGRITVSAPWELEEGADRYALAPGERKTFGVWFKPLKSGWSQGDVRFSGGASASVQLRAEALDWVEVARDPLAFEWTNAKEQGAELMLSNSGGELLELTLQASPPLVHDSNVRVEAGKSLSIPLRWQGNAVPGGWGTLLLSSQTGMRRVLVWSLDAVLSGLGPAFVLADESGAVGARRTLTNVGGKSGTWRFRCAPPFYLGDAEQLSKEPPMPAPGSFPATPALTAKNTGERAAPPGFVWDHNLNRFIPAAGTVKAVPTPAPQAKEQPPAVPKPPTVTRAPKPTDLTRSLQPGESFVLFVGLSGKPAGPGGTLSVEGPGQSTVEPLVVVEVQIPPVPPPPAVAPVAGAALPVPSLPPPSPSAVAPVPAALPSLFTKKAKSAKAPPPPPPAILQQAFLPGLVLPGFRVQDVTSHSATIVFPAGPGVTPEHLVVRYREIYPVEEGDPRVEWVPFNAAHRPGRRVGPNIEIQLRGLLPGWVNCIDLLGPASVNGSRDRLFQVDITTPPADGVLSEKSPWRSLVLVTVLGGVVFLWRRSR